MSEIKVLKDFDIFPLVGYINDDENVNNTQVNGAYTTVRNRFATKKQLEYVPIVELFELKDENLLFIDEEYFNKRVKEVRDKDIFERKKEESLLVNQNDLIVGNTVVLLNFTNLKIAIRDMNNNVKVFTPIKTNNQEFLRIYRGKVVLLTVTTINDPMFIKNIIEGGDFLEIMKNELEYVNSPATQLTYEACRFISDVYKEFTGVFKGNGVHIPNFSPTIKVVSVGAIPEEKFINEVDGEKFTNTFFIEALNLVISSDSAINVPLHPFTNKSIAADIFSLNKVKENEFRCYIVDSKHIIKKRYFNFCGEVMEIPIIQEEYLPDGLYIVYPDTESKKSRKIFFSLEDILNDKVPYVYETKEEALCGLDIGEKEKMEYDRIIRELERDNILLKKKLEENQYRRKDEYENKKYQRDILVETIKTTATVLSLLGTIFLLVNKMGSK